MEMEEALKMPSMKACRHYSDDQETSFGDSLLVKFYNVTANDLCACPGGEGLGVFIFEFLFLEFLFL